MLVRFLGFVLLAVLPGALHAQEVLSCAPPVLNGGYFSPKLNKYSKETLTYSCDTGRKPVVEGWWATATCQDGVWSPEPQCIDERSCIPPIIPNGKYIETQNGWYEEHQTITVQCDDGYQLKGKGPRIKCNNGEWSHLPVCEKRQNACDMPPKIPNAVIIGQEPQEVFAPSSELKYECEEGYDAGTADTRRVLCQRGTWTQGPACRQVRPCGMEPAVYKDVYLTSTEYIEEGESKYFPCQARGHTISVRCNNRRLETNGCTRRPCGIEPADYEEYINLSSTTYIEEGQEKYFQCRTRGYTFYARCINRRLVTTGCCNDYYRPPGYCVFTSRD